MDLIWSESVLSDKNIHVCNQFLPVDAYQQMVENNKQASLIILLKDDMSNSKWLHYKSSYRREMLIFRRIFFQTMETLAPDPELAPLVLNF